MKNGKQKADSRPKVGFSELGHGDLKAEGRGRKPVLLPAEIDPRLAAVMLFTKPQMAVLLQVSMRGLEKLMKRGEITYLKINGRLVRFRAETVLNRLSEVAQVTQGTDECGGESERVGAENLKTRKLDDRRPRTEGGEDLKENQKPKLTER